MVNNLPSNVRDVGLIPWLGDFIFLGSKITSDGDDSHEIKRHMHLEEKL